MEESKPFWASRTIWVGVLGIAFPLLAAAGLLPDGLREEQVLDAVMAALGVLTVIFRARARTVVAPVQAGPVR
jgi:hypothetical protein